MPAELLEDPAGIARAFTDGRRSRHVVTGRRQAGSHGTRDYAPAPSNNLGAAWPCQPQLAPRFSGGFQPSSQHWPLMAGIVSALTDDGAG